MALTPKRTVKGTKRKPSARPVRTRIPQYMKGAPLWDAQSLLPPCPGVYMITYTPTGHVYVGSSASLLQRLITHVMQLTNRNHYNKRLQAAFNISGIAAFTVTVLHMYPKGITTDELIAIEQKEIDKRYAWMPHKGFNRQRNADYRIRRRPDTPEPLITIKGYKPPPTK
jgi:hypothetical protein